ncbi:MAG TPA: MFS transporter [Methylomirabilota bacterium]|nr:MFS transporter [Methylomirabilota bacterium]
MPPHHPQHAVPPGSGLSVGWVRWGVCALLFFAATINYIDRQVIGILKPTLVQEFGWKDERIYAAIVFSFQLAYAVGLLLAGPVIDRLGTRRGLALAVALWSVAAMGHAAASWFPWLQVPSLHLDAATGLSFVALSGAAAGFALMRFALGLGEAGAFPASIKTVAEWFPRRERALATGIFNSGTNIGALVTPLVVPWITLEWGWQWAFLITGATGFVWVAAWLWSYHPPERHSRLTAGELAHIRSDPPETTAPLPWTSLLRHRPTWAFALGKMMTDPIWWLYLFWVPDFLNRNHGLDLKSIGLPIVVIYLVADVGSIGGGWISSALIRWGWTINAARKLAMLVCAVAVLPILWASRVSELWTAVAIVGLAAAAHQGWSANLFTLVSDTFPRHAVGSVVGIGGMAGAVGGMMISLVVGEILQRTGSYLPIFLIAGTAYLAAFLVIHALVPRLAPVQLAPRAQGPSAAPT